MKQILIVDDSRTVRDSLKFFLKEGGYDVLEGADGVEALKILETSQPHLIITDVNMPNMDGLTLLENVRKSSTHKFTPVLVLTTESQQSIMDRGKALGATGWIVKPFNSQKVMAVIKKVLGE